MTLIEWLRVQLDEDEATADAFHHDVCDLNADDYVPGKTPCTCGHPAFLLAEVKAKRAILDRYDSLVRRLAYATKLDDQHQRPQLGIRLNEVFTACIVLAQPYAGREGWQDEWSVGEAQT